MGRFPFRADQSPGKSVAIRHIFVVKPLAALAILVCLGTIVTLFRFNRKSPKSRSDRFLVAFLGLLAAYEGLKLLREAGVVALSMNSVFSDAIELLVATSCLVASIMLRVSRVNHLEVESAIRLAHAAPPRLTRPDVALGSKDSATLETLVWAIPRLSDSAFKLFTVLCLRSEAASGRIPVGVVDVQLKLGKSKEDLDRYLKELEDAGAVALHKYGTTMDIEIIAQQAKSTPASQPLAQPTLVTDPRT